MIWLPVKLWHNLNTLNILFFWFFRWFGLYNLSTYQIVRLQSNIEVWNANFKKNQNKNKMCLFMIEEPKMSMEFVWGLASAKKSHFYSFLFWWVKMRRQENSFLSMLVGKIYPASGICFLCLTTSGTHQLWERRSTYPMQGIPSPANVTLNK